MGAKCGFKVQAQQEFARNLADLEKDYQLRNYPKSPNNQLAQVHKHTEIWHLRLERCDQTTQQAKDRLAKQQARLTDRESQKTHLMLHLQRFQIENDANHKSISAIFRFDAGFGNSENLVLLIKMGYEISPNRMVTGSQEL